MFEEMTKFADIIFLKNVVLPPNILVKKSRIFEEKLGLSRRQNEWKCSYFVMKIYFRNNNWAVVLRPIWECRQSF